MININGLKQCLKVIIILTLNEVGRDKSGLVSLVIIIERK